jgi:hypothetical protein
MRSSISAAAFLFALCLSARAETPSVQDYLEGSWEEISPGKPEVCPRGAGLGTELEFEFRKSGGRLLIFERPDLFTPVALDHVEQNGDLVTVFGVAPDDSIRPSAILRRLTTDTFELLPVNDPKGSGRKHIAVRCEHPNRGVNAEVPMERLAFLTPAKHGPSSLVAVQPGISDEDICRGRPPQGKTHFDVRSIQFEALGPVHFWVLGWPGWDDEWKAHHLIFAIIRQISVVDDKTLRLDMQQQLERGAWDSPESRGERFTLTIVEKGNGHAVIPELNSEFVRCTSFGMRRW